MGYKPRTSKEINLHKINVLMKGVDKGTKTKKDVAKELNQRFERLKKEDIAWYEDLYPKYINLMRIA